MRQRRAEARGGGRERGSRRGTSVTIRSDMRDCVSAVAPKLNDAAPCVLLCELGERVEEKLLPRIDRVEIAVVEDVHTLLRARLAFPSAPPDRLLEVLRKAVEEAFR